MAPSEGLLHPTVLIRIDAGELIKCQFALLWGHARKQASQVGLDRGGFRSKLLGLAVPLMPSVEIPQLDIDSSKQRAGAETGWQQLLCDLGEGKSILVLTQVT